MAGVDTESPLHEWNGLLSPTGHPIGVPEAPESVSVLGVTAENAPIDLFGTAVVFQPEVGASELHEQVIVLRV